MDIDRPILCLEHCKNSKIFGFTVPPTCPTCEIDLKLADLRIPPFRVPSPFRDAARSPCAIVLKPTAGDFLTEYKNADNLHIGVTSSAGNVYEFDSNGLQADQGRTWTRCLTIRDLNKAHAHRRASGFNSSWEQFWDFTLDIISGQSCWAKDKYNESTHNCYTFVLTFLRALQIDGLSDLAKDKATFCSKFILPKTTHAAKYITLYRKLTNELN